ncbi:MAG TPA: S1 RNA-binding domain-containing protein, partial [Polyangiaceae bacterium]|nr:S1 RNA-binding domain-containing protein [Polyangiaceae bacterium]
MTDQIEMTPEEGSQEESFASLFEQTTAASGFGKEGEIVKGRVIQIARDHVVVDIGGKSEGVIPLSEFSDGSEKALSPGELVDVFIEARENDDGL